MPRPYNRKTKPESPLSTEPIDSELAADVTPTTGQPELVQAFLAAMKQMSSENRETTLAAIQELKKLSPEDQEKAEKEKVTAADVVVTVPETPPVDAAVAASVQLPAIDTPPAIV